MQILSIAFAEPIDSSVNEVPAIATVNPTSMLGADDSQDFVDDFVDEIYTRRPNSWDLESTLRPSNSWDNSWDNRTESWDEAEGEACRMKLINKWLDGTDLDTDVDIGMDMRNRDQSSPENDEGNFDASSLKAIRETSLYKTMLEDCSFFLNEFNLAAGFTCMRQEQNRDTSYSDFWKIGPINMDGGWLLAAELLLSNNLEDSRPLVPCSDSCYVRYPRGLAESDCQQSEDSSAGSPHFDVTAITSVSLQEAFSGEIELQRYQQVLCYLGWLDTDRAYQNLRMCASESKVARTMIFEKDNGHESTHGVSERTRQASLVANAFAAQRQKQAECADSAIQFVCPRFDDAAAYDEWDDDGFYHSHAQDDDYIYPGASNAQSTAVNGILPLAAATVALVTLFKI